MPQKQRNSMIRICRMAVVTILYMICFPSSSGAAEKYPNKPIVLVVGFPAGGGNDVVARIIAPKLGELLNTSVVVENKPGTDGIIGANYVAKSKPDGYTLLVASASPLVIAPYTYPDLPYHTLRDFTPITTVGMNPEVLAVNPALPVNDLRGLFDLSKKRRVTIASSGLGGMPHFMISLLQSAAQGQITEVPYKGGPQGIVDTLGGHVDGVVLDLPALLALIKQGKLKGLMATGTQRSEFLPDLPTGVEQGFPTLDPVNWLGVLAPRDTPANISDTLHTALVKAASMPDVKAALAHVGVSSLTMASRQAFKEFLGREYQRWGRVANAQTAQKPAPSK